MKRVRGALSAAVVLSVFACAPVEEKTVPAELLGVWKTSAESHAGRSLELRSGELRFGTGGGSFQRHGVLGVSRSEADGRRLYEIRYLSTEGYEGVLSVYYQPGPGVLLLKNQEEREWRKEGR